MKQGPVFLIKLNRSGQAAIEYVLLLIVIVTMLFLFKGVFTGMNAFMSDFMGKYIVCLMEHGELPAMGVQDTDLKQHQSSTSRKCDFTKFSAAAGIGTGGSSGSGSGGSGSGSSGTGRNGSAGSGRNADSSGSQGSRSGGNRSGSGSEDSVASASGGSGGSGGSRARRGRSARASRSPYDNGMISRNDSLQSADSGELTSDANRVKLIENPNGSRDGDFDRESNRTRRYRGARRGGRYVAVTGNGMQEEKEETRPRTPASRMEVKEESYMAQPKKKTFRPPDQKVAFNYQDQEENMTFGNFFKWLVIAGIVIAAFILFGGQILGYSNSKE